jgi:hypothetical protein
VIATVAVVAGGALWAVPSLAGSGSTDPVGTDPLSDAEIATAKVVADVGADRPNGRTTLRIERHDDGKRPTTRLADVFVYDYSNDTLERTVVDVDAEQVVDVERTTNVQLPLTQDEQARALSVFYGNRTARAALDRAYRAVAHRALTDVASQLSVSVGIFRADSMPDRAIGAAARCGRQRCGQLLLSTADRHLLVNLLPVVNLSTGRVVSIDGFFGPEGRR